MLINEKLIITYDGWAFIYDDDGSVLVSEKIPSGLYGWKDPNGNLIFKTSAEGYEIIEDLIRMSSTR